MAKKTCVPGLFCIENMTFFCMFILIIVLAYLYYVNIAKAGLEKTPMGYDKQYHEKVVQPVVIMSAGPPLPDVHDQLRMVATNKDPLQSEYAPPLKNMYMNEAAHGLPINMKTRGRESKYSQVGILTRKNGNTLILPLMGRSGTNGRDKYQYYTMTNSGGNIHTKLPVSVKGKSCTSQMGCDQIYDGDSVYVEGYDNIFHATIYENSLMQYIPYV